MSDFESDNCSSLPIEAVSTDVVSAVGCWGVCSAAEGVPAMVATLRNHNAHGLNVGISCSTEGKGREDYVQRHVPTEYGRGSP